LFICAAQKPATAAAGGSVNNVTLYVASFYGMRVVVVLLLFLQCDG
jgi:hypothetical protein